MRLARLLTATALAVGATSALATPASASCAAPPRTSAYAFTGTVVSTELNGRIAHVVTDTGRRVTVRGTTGDSDSAATSVDRTYTVGARYEFHPVNNADPFQDNACTATHQLAGGTAPVAGGYGTAMVLGIGAALVLFAGVAAMVVRRRRSRRA